MVLELMEMAAHLWLVLIIAIPVSFVTGKAVAFLHDAMSYGNYFDWIRISKARKEAAKLGMADDFDAILESVKVADFEVQDSMMTALYIEIIKKDKSLKRWTCQKCLTAYLSLVPTAIGVGFIMAIGLNSNFFVATISLIMWMISVPSLSYWVARWDY